MSLPVNTSTVLQFLTGVESSEETFFCSAKGGSISIPIWNETALGIQPTEAEIITAAASPEFATWLAEHGGDPVLTNRRVALEEGIDGDRALSTSARAEMAERNKRDNYLVARILELQAALDAIKASTGPVASIRNAIPASWSPTATRPRADARQDLRDAINAGDGDN